MNYLESTDAFTSYLLYLFILLFQENWWVDEDFFKNSSRDYLLMYYRWAIAMLLLCLFLSKKLVNSPLVSLNYPVLKFRGFIFYGI